MTSLFQMANDPTEVSSTGSDCPSPKRNFFGKSKNNKGFALPDIKVPDIKVPDIKVPDIKIPDIKVGEKSIWRTVCRTIPFLIMVLLLSVVILLAFSFSQWKKEDPIKQNNRFLNPQIVALVTCSIAAISLVLFLSYSFFVRWRQRELVKAEAVVSSLFPAQVKEQLYEMDVKKQNKRSPRDNCRRNSNEKRPKSNEDRTSNADTEGDSSSSSDDHLNVPNLPSGPQIAEFYKASTILFADIAGFTQWSSDRQPSDVFTFLEKLYGGFDQAALAHGIFKIETIGDCYVAVAGLPEPCDDHAIKMVKFSKEMLNIFAKVQNEFGEQLETQNLALRTGIHSGPVTAGVLRGERARYQLFGDTVNTTARHESSGKPGKIHISKETADLLIQAGKRDWIRPRRTRVYAKGKGQLETFWIVTGNETTVDDALDWTCGAFSWIPMTQNNTCAPIQCD